MNTILMPGSTLPLCLGPHGMPLTDSGECAMPRDDFSLHYAPNVLGLLAPVCGASVFFTLRAPSVGMFFFAARSSRCLWCEAVLLGTGAMLMEMVRELSYPKRPLRRRTP